MRTNQGLKSRYVRYFKGPGRPVAAKVRYDVRTSPRVLAGGRLGRLEFFGLCVLIPTRYPKYACRAPQNRYYHMAREIWNRLINNVN